MSAFRLNLNLAHTHLQPQEATLLYAVALSHRPRRVLEVGSFQGGSAHILAQALIDAGLCPTPDNFFMIDPEPRLVAEHASFLEGKTTIIARGSPVAYGDIPRAAGSFDLAFIDGDHAEEAVYADLIGVRPLLAEGAIVLCHDSFYVPTMRGIDRVVAAGGFIDFGQMVSSPVTTDQIENGYRVEWGGLRMLRRGPASATR
jgi:predicted O-methyltransferase YrrM